MPKSPFKRTPRFLRQAMAPARYSSAAAAAAYPGMMALPSTSGITVTPQTALTFTAYYAGVRVISEDAASLPLVMFRRAGRKGSRAQWDHPVTERFNRSPDGETTDMQWREAYYAHGLGWGNAYAEIDWSKGGECLGLHLMSPQHTEARRDENRALYYQDNSPNGIMTTGGVRRIPPYKMLHMGGLGFNGLVGYNPTGLFREAVGLGKASEQLDAAYYGNGAWAGGWLEFPGKLKPEALANLRASYNAVHQGSANGHKVGILEEGGKFNRATATPSESQSLPTRAFQRIEMASVLRIPPHKLGDFSNADLANIEASNDDYLISCLRPWTTRFEKTCNLKLLSLEEWKAGFYLKHDFRPLILMLSKDRADYYRKLLEIGIYTPSEVSVLEGGNPIPAKAGGDKRFRPANLVELDKDTPVPDPTQAPGSPGEPGRPAKSSLADGRFDLDFGHPNGHFSHENGEI